MECCVFCESKENLNTTMTVALDNGTKVSVKICDQHAEDATVKSVRTAYIDRDKQIQEVLSKAAALGLTLTPSTGGKIIVATQNEQPKQQLQQPQPQQKTIVESLEGPDVVSTSIVDRSGKAMSVSGNTDFGMVEAHAAMDKNSLSDKLSPDVLKGKVKMGIVEGRSGQQLVIPEVRIDGTGTTITKIVKKENDTTLQKRFKKMADDSIYNNNSTGFKQGYADHTRICPICKGDCVIGKKRDVCPKCKGAGVINIYE